MIRFAFNVNESFLKSDIHPITIPKATYGRLEKEGLDENDGEVICPDGTRMAGKIYSGRAGFGSYCQIRFHGGYRGDPLNQLKIGQLLNVEIEKTNAYVLVRLQRAKKESVSKPSSSRRT